VVGVPVMAASTASIVAGLAVGADGLADGAKAVSVLSSRKDRSGRDFTRAGKRDVIESNRKANEGQTICESCGTETVPAQQSKKGVTPPGNETHVDHVQPKSKGGEGAPGNGQVLCRDCNLEKSDTYP
ncbi:HNH endonuclease, partial [Corallococcus carmarthensis]